MSQHRRFPVRPLYDVIIVKPLKEAEKTAGGLYLPMGTSQNEMREGEIVAVGTGRLLPTGEVGPFAVKVGDRVMYGQFAGAPLEMDRERYLAMHENDVLGVIEPTAESAVQ